MAHRFPMAPSEEGLPGQADIKTLALAGVVELPVR